MKHSASGSVLSNDSPIRMKLSILDVLPVMSGHNAASALRGARDLAILADGLRYHRIWYAEHHGMGNIAATSPELMIAHVGGLTSRIRLGAGGVMLPNHVPLRVAEQYRALHALFPGRVDLGIGRASGSDPLTARALRAEPAERFPAQLDELMKFGGRGFAADHPYSRVSVTPDDVALPPLFMLGSSGGSARLAGMLGVGYAYAGHFSPISPVAATQAYRKTFKASQTLDDPYVILAVHALCAETEDEAEELALPVLHAITALQLGRMGPVQTPEEVRASGFHAELGRSTPMGRLLVSGTPDTVVESLRQMAESCQASEVMVMTLSHDPRARLRSYQLLDAEWGTAHA